MHALSFVVVLAGCLAVNMVLASEVAGSRSFSLSTNVSQRDHRAVPLRNCRGTAGEKEYHYRIVLLAKFCFHGSSTSLFTCFVCLFTTAHDQRYQIRVLSAIKTSGFALVQDWQCDLIKLHLKTKAFIISFNPSAQTQSLIFMPRREAV